ncbi:tripartite motif-containing protein 43-like [Trichosurus vulpecula]|uniref:tripartite motif-containing protein 43-like n=1 Tax=Trichosurus vulpecula TaxID=9337 RepID=UPI00186AC915|nr:tripartite motif-containing protein 43-like [Trichosurus vulpecula]
MASKEIVPDPQDLHTCTICQVCLPDPATKACGQSFCQSCLSSGNEVSVPLCCSECVEVSQSQAFKSTSRKSKMAVIVKEHQQYPEGPRKCERHQEVQKLFCMDDQIFLCMSCSKSQEHEAHEVCPLEEAAENYRKRLQDNLKCLDENLKDVKKLILEEKEVPRTWAVVWTEQVDMPREVLEEKFQELSEFLSDEEEDVHSLVALDEEENEMFQNVKDHEAWEELKNIQKKNKSRLQLSLRSKDLREMVTTLEEKSQMSDGDLLQDIGDTLCRSESLLLQRPEPFTPKLSNSYCKNLNKFLKKFQGSRLLACHYPYELSDDRKRTFTFGNISSGQTYVVYTSGSIHYMSGRELSIIPLDMDRISEDKQVPPIFACYCLPIERNIYPVDLLEYQ